MGKIKTQFDSRYFFSKHSSLEETHARVEQHVSTGGPQTWTNKSQIRPCQRLAMPPWTCSYSCFMRKKSAFNGALRVFT
jgi:hypothetical protein